MAQKIDPGVINIARSYLKELKDHDVNFESAWLFGSQAQNRSTEDSDIDIALVMQDVAVKFFKEVDLMKYRRKIDSRIEPHIITIDELNLPFYREIEKTGVRLT